MAWTTGTCRLRRGRLLSSRRWGNRVRVLVGADTDQCMRLYVARVLLPVVLAHDDKAGPVAFAEDDKAQARTPSLSLLFLLSSFFFLLPFLLPERTVLPFLSLYSPPKPN